MSNPIFDAIGGATPMQAPNDMTQKLLAFSRTIQGNPEQIVRGLMSSGRMSQQQFNQFSQMARNITMRR